MCTLCKCKGIVHTKNMIFCHNSFTLMLFQTCMPFLSFAEHKKYILKNADCVHIIEVNGNRKLCGYQHPQNIIFHVHRTKKSYRFETAMRVSKILTAFSFGRINLFNFFICCRRKCCNNNVLRSLPFYQTREDGKIVIPLNATAEHQRISI